MTNWTRSFQQSFATKVLLGLLLSAGISALSTDALSQTPTDIQVSSTVQQPAVARLGVNLGDQGYWDSAQIMKNLIFENPGFEGLKYRVIFHCSVVTANTCQDDNQWNAQPAGYWNGGSYRVISGASAGVIGTVVSQSAASTCKSCGPTFQFDRSLSLAKGDYVAVSTYIAGNGDAGWWKDTGGGGTIATETTDLSPNTPGRQAMLLSANAPGQFASMTQAFDTWQNLSFIQLNGAFQVTFRAKGVGGNNQLAVSAQRLQGSTAPYLNKTLTLTNNWQDFTLTFSANETGSAVGPVQLVFRAAGSSVELDDVSMEQTNSSASNPSIFRDDVVTALKELNPGTIRMMASGAALGSDIPNQLQTPFARYRGGFNADGTMVPNVSYGIHEFLQLCQTVGSDPWITIPTSTTPEEMKIFIQYLTGNGSDNWSSTRINRGQTQPWTSVFKKIHIELGNEVWNGSFKGETMAYPAYPQWANQVFGAARQTSGFVAANFDLILSGISATPGYNAPLLSYSNQHDSFDIAPYLLYSANNEDQQTMLGALFAEPELFNSPGGQVYQNALVGAAAPSATGKTTTLSVYETNLGTMIGNITQAQLDMLAPSLAGGLAHAEHMLQMMRVGVKYQNAFSLPQYKYRRSDGSTVRLWGLVVDMGTTNRRRPEYLTQALANSAIGGDMLQTVHSGTNPTWNQPLSSDGVKLAGAHYLQSFAFNNNGVVSVVVFNLHQSSPLTVTFSGPNAPSGNVQLSQITSTNIADNNEYANTVKPTTQTLSGFNPSTGISLPPYSMTVFTASSRSTQAPVFSVPGGSYSSAQSVTIASSTPGSTVYYTTDGSTPTTASTPYTSAIQVTKSLSLEAIAVAPGLPVSPVTSAVYTISAGTVAAPGFSLAGGTYTGTQTVSINDATPGAIVYYTTDGSVPTTNSAVYSGPLTVSQTETVSAIAAEANYSNSAVSSATYTINTPTAATPALSLASGSYNGQQLLTISDTTPGATIYFTTNGTAPTAASTKYTGAITIGATETVEAIATASGYNQSGVATGSYTITTTTSTPAFSLPGGTYASAQAVAITDATPGAVIYYTTNGTAPTSASTVYAGPIQVSVTETVEAIAIGKNLQQSPVVSVAYTIQAPPPPSETATPIFSVKSGSYTSTQWVLIADTTPGAVIYYTTDGTTPGTSSTQYAGVIRVARSETLKAIAVASGYTVSAVSSATYTVGSTPPPNGFMPGEMVLRGSSTLHNTALRLTDGGYGQISAAWNAKKLAVGSFATQFDFTLSNATGDGFTFTVQNGRKGDWESGGNGEALGYLGIQKSVAVKFCLYDAVNQKNVSLTGLLMNGTTAGGQAVDMSSKLNLHSGHLFHVVLLYDGVTLTETVVDSVTKAVFTHSYVVDIPTTLGSTSAEVGFTGSTGRFTAVQDIDGWNYAGLPTATKK